MTKIIVYGCGGKMGCVLEKIINEDKDCVIAAGIDITEQKRDYPTFTDIKDCNVDADVIIDFSTAAAIPALLDYAEEKHIPVVLCTTGLSDETLNRIKAVSEKAAVLKSANMSIGVNLLLDLVKKAAETLYDSNFDIEIVEKHHNRKLDAPSGTAVAIADSINEALDNKMHYVYDRSTVREKRTHDQIGISSLRGGTIVGEHDVVFAGKDEIVTLSHMALSRDIFAVGAVKAAKFLKDKKSGMYTMKEVIADK